MVTNYTLRYTLFRKHNFIISCNIHCIPLRILNLYMVFPLKIPVDVYMFLYMCVYIYNVFY